MMSWQKSDSVIDGNTFGVDSEVWLVFSSALGKSLNLHLILRVIKCQILRETDHYEGFLFPKFYLFFWDISDGEPIHSCIVCWCNTNFLGGGFDQTKKLLVKIIIFAICDIFWALFDNDKRLFAMQNKTF